MASEVLQILNLSPIPELSEMELSTVLEQLSGLSDQNGEVTDRKVEDILREAEELIDTSISVKTESVDSKDSFKYKQNSKRNDEDNTDKSLDIKSSKCDKKPIETGDIAPNSKESTTDILNFSLSSDCNSLENGESECRVSNKNEMDSSEVTPVHTPRSLTNHIQSTLVSLRECSQKIENKKMNSPHKEDGQFEKEFPITTDELSSSATEQNLKTMKSKTIRSTSSFCPESGKTSFDSFNRASKQAVTATRKFGLKENLEKNKNTKKGARSLSLNESTKLLDCFERLYRGKPAQGDRKRLKISDRISNDKKKTSSMKVLRTVNPSKYESSHKVKKSKENDPLLIGKKVETYVYQEFDAKYISPGENKHYPENIIDEDISFEKCLKLLNEESNDQSNLTEITSLNYTELAEKIMRECTASVNALQGEVEDIKVQMKRNGTNMDSLADSKTNFIRQFCSQENIVRVLKEENSKLFKEIEEIKEQLKINVETSRISRTTEKVEVVEKLRSEVENLKRTLITAYSENNGISRLEDQLSLLKRKYDQQIGKLEKENKKLKDALAGLDASEDPENLKGSGRREMGVQTERDNRRFGEMEWRTPKMVRSVSLENCGRILNACPFISHSCESVDVATSPISHGDKELCSVSVQCKGEWDTLDLDRDQPVSRKGAFRQFLRLENKENVGNSKRDGVKTRTGLNVVSQGLNPLKQKKLSEHENQLMVTVRALHSEITVKDRDIKKLRNELEASRNQIRRMAAGIAKHKNEVSKKVCHVGTQTIGLNPKMHEAYDPAMFQVSRELETENEDLKSRVVELEKVVDIMKEKRIRDLQVLQKLHEEEIDKLASRLNTQTALTNHLHSLLTNR